MPKLFGIYLLKSRTETFMVAASYFAICWCSIGVYLVKPDEIGLMHDCYLSV